MNSEWVGWDNFKYLFSSNDALDYYKKYDPVQSCLYRIGACGGGCNGNSAQ